VIFNEVLCNKRFDPYSYSELLNKVSGIEIAPYQYTYDKVGNKTQITDKYGEHIANYDEVYRLINMTNTLARGGSETFSYDLTGNRTSDQNQNYTSNEINQMTSGTNGLTLSYDANGNVTTKIENGITSSYTWNSENQLIQSAVNGPQTMDITYQYDALGRRISKTVTDAEGSKTTQWIYDGEDILFEYLRTTDSELRTAYFTHGPNIDEPIVKANVTTGQNYYYHADALGSISAITDSIGSVIESYRYTAYGSPQIFDKDGLEITESIIDNPYMHTGREYDSETGLYYHRARYRSSTFGTWISKDPIGFEGGINVYGYVKNNPIVFLDPNGLWEVKHKKLGGTLGMGASAMYGSDDKSGRHWQLFYEDGTNIGYFGDKENKPDIKSDNVSKYSADPILQGSDDDLMKEAIKETTEYWEKQYEEGQRYHHPIFDDERKFDCQEFIWYAQRKYCQKLREKKRKCE